MNRGRLRTTNMISAQRAGMEHRPPGIDPRTVARATASTDAGRPPRALIGALSLREQTTAAQWPCERRCPLPDDVEPLRAMLLAEREAYRTELRQKAVRIEQLKQRIAKLAHEQVGQS